ncbi:MAG: KpsF/GutQ family sugar-phosphate isomerase [Planctomycetota bacterium]
MHAQATTARARRTPTPFSETEVINGGREVIRTEAEALLKLVERLDAEFYRGAHLLHDLAGSLIVTGMGKAGIVGQKLAATFASTGTRAHFMHPAEAFHGDLGRVHRGDIVLVLSHSGETGEVVQLLPALRRMGVPLMAITASPENTLGRVADVTISLGDLNEACSLGLAPSTSTTAMLAVGDALALVVSRLKGFEAEDFAKFHPGGSLGLKLSAVEEHMRPMVNCRVAREDQTIRQVMVAATQPGRRSGAIMLTDADGKLTGVFTDSDLARLIEDRQDAALDRPIREVMTADPVSVHHESKMSGAVEQLVERKISELPVVDDDGCPVGMIDVTDVVGLLPDSSGEAKPTGAARVRIYPADEYAD